MTSVTQLYRPLQDALHQTDAALDPAQLHGLGCGLLCGPAPVEPLLARHAWDAEALPPAAQGLLQALIAHSRQSLASESFEFAPLLPADAAAAGERAAAMAGWCEGFLSGFGLGDARAAGEQAEEALADLAAMAQLEPVVEDDADEDSLAMLEEHLRVAALLLFLQAHEPAGRA